MVTWHLTMKLFPAKCHERATLRKLWRQTGNSSLLPAICWPLLHVMAGISSRFSNFAFVLFCFITNHLMTGPLGNSEFCFPRISMFIEIFGKQNSLFPSGPVIKCLLLYLPTQIRFPIGGECVTCRESKLTKNMNFGLARDQVVLLETAANLWASRSRANDFFALFSSFELFMTAAAGNSEFYFPSTSK